MNAKLSSFSELANILSVKSSLRANLMPLFIGACAYKMKPWSHRINLTWANASRASRKTCRETLIPDNYS